MGWPFADFNLFALIAVRVLAMCEVAPLLSGAGVPQVAKVGLAGFVAALIMPSVKASGYPIPLDGFEYSMLVIGEAMIGLIIGFFLSIVYAAFTTAGQFFSMQMGLSASETYDPLSEVELPVMGQFLNLIAMFVFVSTSGFQKLFIVGVQGSFQAIKAVDLVSRRNDMIQYLVNASGALFQQGLILSMPILGTLFVVTVAMGLLSKAAPQMNFLTEGFPITLSITYVVMLTALPFMMEAFSHLIEASFDDLGILIGGKL
jgi:flagellar biosynthesis protein FliR